MDASASKQITAAVANWYLPTGLDDILKTLGIIGGLYALGYRDRKLILTSTVCLGALAAYALYQGTQS